jgi:iron complex outermembrane receptor protein
MRFINRDRRHGAWRVIGCALLLVVFVPTVRAQSAQQRAIVSLDSLLSTRISAASKYEQTSAEAPASVTILTSDDLERAGYRTLDEALETVRGFYVTNDRTLPYLGTRGFSRPSDYNNRVLVLVDGHTLNDQTWGGAPIGSDLPLNFDAVERIEIVRGPGSALYGTSAMFAVINIVTKTGGAIDGAIVRARTGSGGLRQATLAAGHSFGARVSVAASGIVMRRDGKDLYFPEFDTGVAGSGISHSLDWERATGGLASVTAGNVVARAGYRVRGKGIPTGAFDIVFNDPRAETVDETGWADVKATHDFTPSFRGSLRAYADRYRYRGAYPAADALDYNDGGGSTATGAEALATWEWTSRNRLTLGSEIRHMIRADYYEELLPGQVTRDDVPSSVLSFFAQDELQVSPSVTFVGGIRSDRTTYHGQATAPRLTMIYTPSASTTVKTLFGEAFRAPSPAEADITTSFYSENPALRPERIRSAEVTLTQRAGSRLLLSGSAYAYRLRGLIDAVEPPSGEGIEYRNVASSDGEGIELEAELRPLASFEWRASYAFQSTDDEPSGELLTNSPAQIASLSATRRVERLGLTSMISARYESGRKTLAGPSTRAFTRTDAHVAYAPQTSRLLHGATVGMRVTNLFDVRYASPAGIEHRQTAIPQDGRAISFDLSWRF